MEIRNRVRTSLGVPQLEAQIVSDKQLDTDFYNKEFLVLAIKALLMSLWLTYNYCAMRLLK